MTLPCPRCGAKNSEDAAACYACGAALHAAKDVAADEIPDPLMDAAKLKVEQEPPLPLSQRERAERMGLATAITLGIVLLMGLFGWIFAFVAILVFPLALLAIAAVPIGLAAVWSWALKKEKQ